MNEIEQSTAGMLFAVQAVLRALIAAHPEPSALRAELHEERESTLAWLLGQSTPERTIDACRDFLDHLGADPGGEPASPRRPFSR